MQCIEKVIDQFEEVTGSKKVPVTLASTGVEPLQTTWQKARMDPLEIVGKESVEMQCYNKK